MNAHSPRARDKTNHDSGGRHGGETGVDETAQHSCQLDALEARLGYRFARRGLLELALTHPSCAGMGHPHNQRLEFLGDAMLGLMLADQLYNECPGEDEGSLTIMRSQHASGAALAEIAREIGIGEMLRLAGGADLEEQRALPSNLAAALEAIIGAAWVDGGMPAAAAVYGALFSRRVASGRVAKYDGNPKGRLQEAAQHRGAALPQYEVLAVDGPEHAPIFSVRVTAFDKSALGTGSSKRSAEIAAAANWLEQHGNQ